MNPLLLAYLVIGVIATAMYVWAMHRRTSRHMPIHLWDMLGLVVAFALLAIVLWYHPKPRTF